MKRSKSQFSRLLELDRQIRANMYPNCLTFAADWEVSQKTIQRDIDFLRDALKAPLAYDKKRSGFYYTDLNWFMPAMTLSEGELVSLLMATRMFDQLKGSPIANHLEAVAAKIQGMLPGEVTLKPDLLFDQFSVTLPPARPIRDSLWLPIIRALQSKRTLRIRYTAFDADKAKEWDFNPYHMANLQGEWYLFGQPAAHKNTIQIAMGRLESATLKDATFTLPSDFDFKKILATTFGRSAIGSKPQKVRLIFDKSIAPWIAQRQWHPEQKFRTLKDGRVEMTFKAVGLYEVQRWVLSCGGDVEVVKPKELREAVATEAKRICKKVGKS